MTFFIWSVEQRINAEPILQVFRRGNLCSQSLLGARVSIGSLTFGLLASEAAGVVLLLPLRSRRAGSLQPRRVLELLGARHLLVDVVGKVPHDADAVLHRLRTRKRRMTRVRSRESEAMQFGSGVPQKVASPCCPCPSSPRRTGERAAGRPPAPRTPSAGAGPRHRPNSRS